MSDDYIERLKMRISKALSRKTNLTSIAFEKDTSIKLGFKYLIVNVETRYGGKKHCVLLVSKEMELSRDMEDTYVSLLLSDIENFIYQDSRRYLSKKKAVL